MAEKMKQSNASTNAAALSAEKIAQLESEIQARRAEIKELQDASQDNRYAKKIKDECKPGSKSEAEDSLKEEALNNSLEELIVLWEQRLAKCKINNRSKKDLPSASGIHDAFRDPPTDNEYDHLPDMPSIVYTSSTDSDETRDAPPSPSPRGHALQHSPTMLFGSPRRVVGLPKPIAVYSPRGVLDLDLELEPAPSHGVQVLERTVEERDQKIEFLEAVIASDTDMIKKMKDTIEKMIDERKDTKSKSSLQIIVGELESAIKLQEKQNETLKDECVRLQRVIKSLEGNSSSQENIIEFMKAEMIKLLFTSRISEEELDAKLSRRGETIADLENAFKENADKSKRMITAMGVRSSALEDQIEDLRAENLRLQVQSQTLAEEKTRAEEAMKTEMQLFYIENSLHEIL